jgi:hypothetical protein
VEKKTIKAAKPTPASLPASAEKEKNGAPNTVRTASPEQFKKAHAKTIAKHAGLFRRLAK